MQEYLIGWKLSFLWIFVHLCTDNSLYTDVILLNFFEFFAFGLYALLLCFTGNMTRFICGNEKVPLILEKYFLLYSHGY